MKCPFVDRDCIGRECAGWSNGICFVENFTQKMDTLCNLISRLGFDLANRASLLEAGPGESKAKTDPTETIEAELEEEETTKISSSSWQPISAPVSVGESILAIDFGTALSKVAIRPISQNRTIPVPLAEVAGKILDSAGERTYLDENRFVQDSIIYIDDDSKVLCGSLAKSRYIEVSNYRRDAIQNLKQFLIGGGTRVTLQDSYFPTSERLSTQEVLATYLAYLFHLTRNYVGGDVDLKIDLDATVRNFSIPVWDDKKYRNEVKEIVKGAISKGYCLEKFLKQELVLGVQLQRLREALEEAKQFESEISGLLGTDVSEPVAAGYSRVNELELTPGLPWLLFVIDVGAGSTDFALLTIAQPRDGEDELKIFTSLQGGVGKGVSIWDNALRSILHNRFQKLYGVTKSHPQFQTFSTALEVQLRTLKESVMKSKGEYQISIPKVLTTPITISRDELASSEPVQVGVSEIQKGFKKYIDNVKETIDEHIFDASRTEFLITGGGSFVPSIVDCIRECTRLLGPSYAKKVKHRYLPESYATIPNFIDVYPMLAVSLGATEREYPKEEMIPPIGPHPGPHEIGGYYTKGI